MKKFNVSEILILNTNPSTVRGFLFPKQMGLTIYC